MSSLRVFEGFAEFAHFIEESTPRYVSARPLVLGALAEQLQREVKSGYGSHELEDLAPATQADRVRKGYTPNDPLLRDGSLLRDSTERHVGDTFAAVGSSEPVAAYHEFGYVDARTGRSVPPRPVYKMALDRIEEPAAALLEDLLGVTLGVEVGTLAELAPNVLTGGTT